MTVTAQTISQELKKKHDALGDVYFAQVKNGSTWFTKDRVRILDGWAMNKSYASPTYTGYEIKISRGDFVRDDKWESYLPYCHRFYFVCPRGMIRPKELVNPNVGLIYYNPDSPVKKLRTVKSPHRRTIETPPAEFFQYLLFSKVDVQTDPDPTTEEMRRDRAQAIYNFIQGIDGANIPIHEVGYMLQQKYWHTWQDLQARLIDLDGKEKKFQKMVTENDVYKIAEKYFPVETQNAKRIGYPSKEDKLKALDRLFSSLLDARLPANVIKNTSTLCQAAIQLNEYLKKHYDSRVD